MNAWCSSSVIGIPSFFCTRFLFITVLFAGDCGERPSAAQRNENTAGSTRKKYDFVSVVRRMVKSGLPAAAVRILFEVPAFDIAIVGGCEVEETGEVLILYPGYQVRIMFHKIAEATVGIALPHFFPLVALEIVFLEKFGAVPVEGRPFLEDILQLLEGDAVKDGRFEALYGLRRRSLAEKAAYRRINIPLPHEPGGELVAFVVDAETPDKTFFDKAEGSGDGAFSYDGFPLVMLRGAEGGIEIIAEAGLEGVDGVEEMKDCVHKDAVYTGRYGRKRSGEAHKGKFYRGLSGAERLADLRKSSP